MSFLHVLLGFQSTEYENNSALITKVGCKRKNNLENDLCVAVHLTTRDDSLPTSLSVSPTPLTEGFSACYCCCWPPTMLCSCQRGLCGRVVCWHRFLPFLSRWLSLALQISLLNRNIFAVTFMNCSVLLTESHSSLTSVTSDQMIPE